MAIDLDTIKEKILEDDLIEPLLIAMECENIEYRSGRWEAQLPEKFHSSNRRGVQVYENPSLSSYIRNRNFSGDIFSLVSYIVFDMYREEDNNKNLPKAKNWILTTLQIDEDSLESGNPLDFLKKIRKSRKVEMKYNPILDEKILDQYIDYPYYHWIKEGIGVKTQKDYGIKFDLDTHRVIIPIRNCNGELIGIKGRTVEDSEYKYLYLYNCNKSYDLFNLDKAKEAIKKVKKVVIVEAEKSCMQAYENNIHWVVAMCGSDLSPIQCKLLHEMFGDDIEVVIALDKDKGVEDVKKVLRNVKHNNVSCVMCDDAFGEKMSPFDLTKEDFIRIFKKRKKVNMKKVRR